MGAGDRLDWIFDDDDADLEAKYDRWAATYDDDHDRWGWRGPELIVETAMRLADLDRDKPIYDAGCGTGRVGVLLRRAGWTGGLVGLDLSQGMLDVAAGCRAYDELIRCSLVDLPQGDATATAVLSCGVFTHGHVGGEALAELARITAPGGLVCLTQRVEVEGLIQPFADELARNGTWRLVERTEPQRFHPERDETKQAVTAWRICLDDGRTGS